MISNETMLLLARFSMGVRKSGGQVDTKRLAKDPDYRKEVFKLIEKQDDTDLLMLSYSIKSNLDIDNIVPISRLRWATLAKSDGIRLI